MMRRGQKIGLWSGALSLVAILQAGFVPAVRGQQMPAMPNDVRKQLSTPTNPPAPPSPRRVRTRSRQPAPQNPSSATAKPAQPATSTSAAKPAAQTRGQAPNPPAKPAPATAGRRHPSRASEARGARGGATRSLPIAGEEGNERPACGRQAASGESRPRDRHAARGRNRAQPERHDRRGFQSPGCASISCAKATSLYDGQVEHITMDGVSFHQTGKDAFGKAVEREVTKRLYPTPGEQQ